MNNEYPKMLYKEGGNVFLDGKYFSTLIVSCADKEAEAIKQKWKFYYDLCNGEKNEESIEKEFKKKKVKKKKEQL
jgi:hypothetical protein